MQIGVDYRKRYLVDHNWYFHNPDYIVEGIDSILNGLLGHISDMAGKLVLENMVRSTSYKEFFSVLRNRTP